MQSEPRRQRPQIENCRGQGSHAFCIIMTQCVRKSICGSPLRRAEAITWENFVPAKRDPSSTKEAPRLAEIKLFNFLYTVCNL